MTEFLPVSSTGHLLILAGLLKVPQTDFIKTFEIVIQFGAISSIIFLYWQKINNLRLVQKITAAFIPTALTGFLFYKVIKDIFFEDLRITVWALFVGGIVLILVEKILYKKENKLTLNNLSLKKSILIGLMQSVSIIPGVSRAAATIVGGRILGLNRTDSLEFSFLLAVPTILAASAYDLFRHGFTFNQNELLLLAVGFSGAFISAYLTVKFFLNFVKSNSLAVFGVYRILIAGILFFFY